MDIRLTSIVTFVTDLLQVDAAPEVCRVPAGPFAEFELAEGIGVGLFAQIREIAVEQIFVSEALSRKGLLVAPTSLYNEIWHTATDRVADETLEGAGFTNLVVGDVVVGCDPHADAGYLIESGAHIEYPRGTEQGLAADGAEIVWSAKFVGTVTKVVG